MTADQSEPVRTSQVSRRALLGTGAALGVGAPLAGLGAAPATASGGGHHPSRSSASVRAAVRFLQQATDAHRTSGARLAQSYQDNSGLEDTAFVYDNALASIALLTSGDVTRARAIGDALLYAQTHDGDFTDFRLRQAYQANVFVDTAKDIAIPAYKFGLLGTAVGDMAWSGIALAQLAKKTRKASYLTGAVRIAEWIQANTYSTTGLGGYTFGETAGLEDHKSTEHNIDVYAFFRLIATLTGDRVWKTRAAHAWDFVEAVWNAEAGFFWTGSDDGAAINKSAAQLPADPQTWSWLAARDRTYAASVDWAASNLATTDTPLRPNSALTGNQSFRGIAFASGSFLTDPTVNIGGQSYNPKPDPAAVWFEGTAQLAVALTDRAGADRDSRGDEELAADLRGQIKAAQSTLGQGQTFGGKATTGGIVAASSPLDTGFGFGYYPNLHVGATAWYVFAGLEFNPYRF